MAGVINLALSVVRVGSGLQLVGDTLSVIAGQSTVDSVVAPAGSTLTLAANDSSGGVIVLGLGDTLTTTAAFQGIRYRVNNQAGAYAILPEDLYVGYTGGGSQAFTLPAASSHTGRLYIIKNRGAGTLTVQVTGGGELWTDENVATRDLLVGECLTVISDGTYWVATDILSGLIVE
jgi:hypothetical protein